MTLLSSLIFSSLLCSSVLFLRLSFPSYTLRVLAYDSLLSVLTIVLFLCLFFFFVSFSLSNTRFAYSLVTSFRAETNWILSKESVTSLCQILLLCLNNRELKHMTLLTHCLTLLSNNWKKFRASLMTWNIMLKQRQTICAVTKVAFNV